MQLACCILRMLQILSTLDLPSWCLKSVTRFYSTVFKIAYFYLVWCGSCWEWQFDILSQIRNSFQNQIMNSHVQHMLEEDLIKWLFITCFGKVLMAVIFALLEFIFKIEFNSIDILLLYSGGFIFTWLTRKKSQVNQFDNTGCRITPFPQRSLL